MLSEETEVHINVIKTSQNGFRPKRSADDFPDDMDIELPVGKDHVSIALHRHYGINNKVPVTVERHGKIIPQTIEDTQVIMFFVNAHSGHFSFYKKGGGENEEKTTSCSFDLP